ncbi:MAG: SUMF1/EgtB/PvdO family nonheme iron enzyme [Anaerolineae bacterium]|nr:SUMF1/EgtB/PvdO family nonheme iron enzyme [Anaerolineae bacterium]
MNPRNRPVEETRALLRASSRYLKEPTPENERVFLRALRDLEAAERATGLTPVSVSGSTFRRNPLSAIAALIVFVLVSIGALVGIPTYLNQQSASATAAALATINTTAPPSITSTIEPSPTATPQLCPVGMIYIEAGEFRMGATLEDVNAQPNEKASGDVPQRLITLGAYCIDRTEVSYGQFTDYSRALNRARPTAPTPSYDSQLSVNDLPVVNVTWEDAQAYCEYQGKSLPTEAQWEKAARGTNGRIYPWGNEWDADRASSARSLPVGFRPVDSYPDGASPYGVLNMAGNASEWVRDWYLPNYYEPTSMPTADPQGPAGSPSSQRVVRGGSIVDSPELLRTSARRGASPAAQSPRGSPNVGFRCAQ